STFAIVAPPAQSSAAKRLRGSPLRSLHAAAAFVFRSSAAMHVDPSPIAVHEQISTGGGGQQVASHVAPLSPLDRDSFVMALPLAVQSFDAWSFAWAGSS